MKIKEAKALIKQEEESESGLLILFRMSEDVSEERLDKFIEALRTIEQYYQGELLIEKALVNQLMWFYRTLNASAGHWKVIHPKGLTPGKVFEIQSSILDVFASDVSPSL